MPSRSSSGTATSGTSVSCPDPVELARCDLVQEALARDGSIFLSALGTSMLPFLWPGWRLRVTHVRAADLRPGDIALYRHHASFILHRYYGKSGELYWFRGDFRLRFDLPVPHSAILGRVEPAWSHPLPAALWRAADGAFRLLVVPLLRR